MLIMARQDTLRKTVKIDCMRPLLQTFKQRKMSPQPAQALQHTAMALVVERAVQTVELAEMA